jgi:hypothetical protein
VLYNNFLYAVCDIAHRILSSFNSGSAQFLQTAVVLPIIRMPEDKLRTKHCSSCAWLN